MIRSKSFIIKTICWILLITFINQLVYPSLSYGLTSANSQPEIWGYQQVDATDNVSLQTGAFNYTIPITSIPEYPMAISYRSGVKMDQEASTFGYGFNGFSGAIARNTMGIPDDINGANRNYTYQNQVRWDASIRSGFSVDFLKGCTAGIVSAGPEVAVTGGYDNYTGVFGALGLGVALGVKLGKSQTGVGVGAMLVSDSRVQGIQYGAGSGVGIGTSLGERASTSTGLASLSVYGTIGGNSAKFNASSVLTDIGISEFSSTTSKSATTLAPLSYVIPSTSGIGVSMAVSIPLLPTPFTLSADASYNRYKLGKDVINKNAYGFGYLQNYNRRENNHIADMTIEGENSFPDNSNIWEMATPSYLQRDYFYVNSMGINGNMQLYQKEYGVVSRNYTRNQISDAGVMTIKTDRKEVQPWVSVNQTKLNKNVDIIKYLKNENPQDRDFDNVLFEEKEVASLTLPPQKFGESIFKMRGDLAGEFDLASADYSDHEANEYGLIHIPGSDHSSWGFLRQEKDMPLYYPLPTSSTGSKYSTAGNIERSTVIKSKTIGDILSQYQNIINSDYTTGAQFNQSFYCHQEFIKSLSRDKDEIERIPDIVSTQLNVNNGYNILNHLNEIKNDYPENYVNDLIGWIEIQNPNGLKYIFNLPVFVKSSENLQLKGKGKDAPDISSELLGEYTSFKKNNKDINRNKLNTKEEYVYPYAWLLTAVVGEDYIDFDNIPGPSDGDIGFWVKFKYVKVADDYKWRVPFTGMDCYPGMIHTYNDDVYALSTGKKEIYNLSEIESSNYTCKYQYKKRFDGLDASDDPSSKLYNGEAHNPITSPKPTISSDPTGTNFQYAVTQIDLYKKHSKGANSDNQGMSDGIVKSTKFYYDYSLCPNVPNNLTNYTGYTGISKDDEMYFLNDGESASTPIGTGKLTLRKIQHITYDKNSMPTTLPSYVFNYWSQEDSKYNPSYDPKCVDMWGNYSAKSKETVMVDGQELDYYHNFCEVDEAQADENSKTFHIKEILLPSGGKLNVDYKAQSYGSVEDKTPYAMRRIKPQGGIDVSDRERSKISVDVTDICLDELANGTSSSNLQGIKKVLKDGDIVYGEIAFYQESLHPSPKRLFIASTDAVVKQNGISSTISNIDGRYYQDIELVSLPWNLHAANQPPFVHECEVYMYGESFQSRVLKERGANADLNSYINDYENLALDNPMTAAIKVVANFVKVFKQDDPNLPSEKFAAKFLNSYGAPGTTYFSHLSFIRTPIYKAKYTGTRVNTLEFSDNFNYATNPISPDNEPVSNSNKYVTRYLFDENSDDTGRSAGVATIEPGGGKAAVIDVLQMKGAGFAPSPAIYSSKTALQTMYSDNDEGTDGITSRNKGKTIYEFYTPKDYPSMSLLKDRIWPNSLTSPQGHFYMFGMWSFMKIKIKIKWLNINWTIKIPVYVPFNLKWNREDYYKMRSYAYTDYTDIYGRPKSIKQQNASGTVEAQQKYSYYGIDEPVSLCKNNFTDRENQRPGKMDQAWSEAYYTKEADITNTPCIMFLNAKTKRNFNYINMKYSYVPPILKEVQSIADGQTVTTTNTAFDYITGLPVEVRSNDSYKNIKIKRTVPAYWTYSDMGPVDQNPNNLNMLTSEAERIIYLNSVSDNNKISWSKTEWTNNKSGTWKFIDYLVPRKVENETGHYYEYNMIQGGNILSAYGTNNDIHIKRNVNLYKPYRSYIYKAELKEDGTFDMTQPNGWKVVNTNMLFDANGNLCQSKDVLDKVSAQHMGYGNSNAISTVTNAMWLNSVFEGAENTYVSSINKKMLEGDRVQLGEATVFKQDDCEKLFEKKTLTVNTNSGPLKAFKVTIPANPAYNVPFAKINVTFNAGTQPTRKLFVSLKDNGDFEVITDQGEEFNGFLVFRNPYNPTQSWLIFDWSVFSSFVPVSGFDSQSFIVSYSESQSEYVDLTIFNSCSINQKEYQLPLNSCFGEVHTGEYGFKLLPHKIGTIFEIKKGSVPYDEMTRKYKAMVWVHNTSPQKTTLKVDNGSIYSATLEQPYVVAGNWSLLRINFEASAKANIKVYVENNSDDGVAVYDDIRVLPYQADMNNYVYDHRFNYVTSTLDSDHFATWANYDSRGRVTKSTVELENIGKKTVKKQLFNDQKID